MANTLLDENSSSQLGTFQLRIKIPTFVDLIFSWYTPQCGKARVKKDTECSIMLKFWDGNV